MATARLTQLWNWRFIAHFLRPVIWEEFDTDYENILNFKFKGSINIKQRRSCPTFHLVLFGRENFLLDYVMKVFFILNVFVKSEFILSKEVDTAFLFVCIIKTHIWSGFYSIPKERLWHSEKVLLVFLLLFSFWRSVGFIKIYIFHEKKSPGKYPAGHCWIYDEADWG